MHTPRFGAEPNPQSPPPPGDCSKDPANCFSAAIYKTADGGKTFDLLFEDINNGTNIYPNDIDCAPGNPDLCIALLEGASCHIWRTADGGASWTEVYSGDATCSVVNAHFVSPAEVWVTGGLGLSTQDQSGAFWHSTDAGKAFEVETVPGLHIMVLDLPEPPASGSPAPSPRCRPASSCGSATPRCRWRLSARSACRSERSMRRDRVYGFLGCSHLLIFCPLSQGCCAVRRFLVCVGGWVDWDAAGEG